MVDRRKIIAEIIAEDKTKSVLSSARRKVKKYRDDIEALNDALTEEEKSALAAAQAIKKLAKEHKDAEQKMQGAKKGLEGIGVSGEALTSVYTLAGFAIGKLAGKMLEFASGAMAKAIEASDAAALASESLTREMEGLEAAAGRLVLGQDAGAESMSQWAKAMAGASEIVNRLGEDLDEGGKTFEWYQGTLWLGESAILAVRDGLIDLGSVAEATKVEFAALTAEQLKMNAALKGSAEFEAAQMKFRGMADFSNTFANRARANLTMASGLKKGGGKGAGKAAAKADGGAGSLIIPTTLEGMLGAAGAEASAAAIKEREADLRRLADAGRMSQLEIARLGEAMNAAFAEAEFERERIIELNSAFEGLATGGIALVTSALGDMITQMVAGEFNLGNFAATLLGQFGSMLKTVGEGAVGLGALFLGLKTGLLASGPGAVIGIGAGLIATGAIMEGLAGRGQKALGGRGGGGGAAAAINDAVSTLGITGGRDDSTPTETVLVVDGREMRGYVVATVNQAADTGELVPMSGDPL